MNADKDNLFQQAPAGYWNRNTKNWEGLIPVPEHVPAPLSVPTYCYEYKLGWFDGYHASKANTV